MSSIVPRVLAAVFVGGLWACSQDLPVAPSGSQVAATTASFKGDVAPLLSATCAGCHASGQDGANQLTLFTGGAVDYSAASKNISKIVRECQRGDMPKGRAKLTTQQLAVLQAWQAAGAPNN